MVIFSSICGCQKSNKENIKSGCTHVWKEATCLEPKTCSICNKTEGSIGSHDWEEATCLSPKTCTICATSVGSKLEHSTDIETCSLCEYVNKDLAIKNAKESIHVYGIDLEVNSAGGVDTYITWKNVSHKEIKYIHFSIQYYNRVKDILKDDINGKSIVRLTSTGPFPYGKGGYEYYSYSNIYDSAESLYFTISSGFKEDEENGWAGKYWEAPFYNTTTQYAKIYKVEIEYMDGSTYNIIEPSAIASIVGNGSHPNAWSTDDTGDDYLR